MLKCKPMGLMRVVERSYNYLSHIFKPTFVVLDWGGRIRFFV